MGDPASCLSIIVDDIGRLKPCYWGPPKVFLKKPRIKTNTNDIFEALSFNNGI
jgi:hypothetical protein